jgi:hypothetical protein
MENRARVHQNLLKMAIKNKEHHKKDQEVHHQACQIHVSKKLNSNDNFHKFSKISSFNSWMQQRNLSQGCHT